MKLALKAVAKLADIKINEAENTNRRNPLFNEEIHIEEELINLEEAISSYHLASDTLKHYPQMRLHILKERRQILKHCIGLISRMQKGRELPRKYDSKDIETATRKLVSLVVEDAKKANYEIDKQMMDVFKPHLQGKQRFGYKFRQANDLFRTWANLRHKQRV